MKKLLCLLLTAVMLCTVLVGCGPTDADKLVGTWEGDIDMTAPMNTYMASQLPELLAGFGLEIDASTEIFSSLSFSCRYVFDKDGTGSLSLAMDEASKATFAAEMIAWAEKLVVDVLRTQLEATLVEQGLDIDIDTYLAANGMTMDDLTGELALADYLPIDDMLSEVESEKAFTYRLEEGKVYMLMEGSEEGEETYADYAFNGNDELSWTEYPDEDEEDAFIEILGGSLKITLTRAE